jgi:ABC-type transporter Mla maintaining outer membrane lipid asymmetry permease subunit MlaE
MIPILIMLPILTAIADIVGIFGGLVVAVTNLGISDPFY